MKRRTLYIAFGIAVLLTSLAVWAGQGRSRVGIAITPLTSNEPAVIAAWFESNLRNALRLAQPVSHFQSGSRVDSILQWSQSPRGSIWLHRRPEWETTEPYYGFVKFHDDTVRRFGFLGSHVLDAENGTLERFGSGTDADPYKLGIDTTHTPHYVGVPHIRLEHVGTDATIKYARFVGGHYTNAEEPISAVFTWGTSTINRLYIGGGDNEYNAVTSIRLFAASDNTTVTGTEYVRIDEDGLRMINGAIYIKGHADFDGSWRIKMDGSNVVHQRRESGSWVTKHTITP